MSTKICRAPSGRGPEKNTGDLQWKKCANYNARPCAAERKAAGAGTMGTMERTMENNEKNNGNGRHAYLWLPHRKTGSGVVRGARPAGSRTCSHEDRDEPGRNSYRLCFQPNGADPKQINDRVARL